MHILVINSTVIIIKVKGREEKKIHTLTSFSLFVTPGSPSKEPWLGSWKKETK